MKAMRIARFVVWFVFAATFPSGVSFGQSPVSKIAVYPPDARLATSGDRQSFVVVATRADGVTEDVTAAAKVSVADPAIARLDGHTLYPLADGATNVAIEYAGQQAALPVAVKDAKVERPISFKLDVEPVFMRTGCNTGSCHGAARGKDGFNLSLFGYDPDGDHFRLTREIGFRRVNLAVPRDSLLLQKSIGAVTHTGGKRMEPDGEHYQTILRWLEAGVPQDPADVAKCVKVELFPPRVVLEGKGVTQQFTVRAHYSDGADRDVTNLAVFLTNNDNSAPINSDGLVTAAERGEAFVMARFSTHTVGSQVIVLPKDAPYSPPASTPVNYIDELVDAKLRDLRILPSERCGDETFLRRVSIDITGLLPTIDEYNEFMSDPDPAKRSKLVDRLLERKEFSEIWALKWSDLLMIKSSNTVSEKSAYLYSNWLTNQISSNVPLDQMVRELLGGSGGTFKNPSTNFYQIERELLKTTENVAQVFMGIRVQCAQCHNHPFDRWTMDDYYGFAAFFSQVGRKQGEDYRELIIYNSGGGEVSHPVGGRKMAPKFLGGETPDLQGKDRRVALAEWLTSPENPYFATSVANRVWAHFFGIGIVEPVDDIRVSNPPSNPELFVALGAHLTQYNYDFKRLVRDICNSNAYQRSTARNVSNQEDEKNFAHARIRRIGAESLLDCYSQVTGTQEKFPGLPLGARAVQIANGTRGTYFLKTFGRSPRETVCACEATTEPTLSQALHLLNGETVDRKIEQGQAIQKLLEAKQAPPQIVENLYLRCLTRKPTPEEADRFNTLVADQADPRVALQDVFWAVLNSREFIFNH